MTTTATKPREATESASLVNSIAINVEAPGRVVLSPMGRVSRRDGGEFTLDQAAAERIINTFVADKVDLVIDYDHTSLGGPYARPDMKSPAAGWIKSLAVDPVAVNGGPGLMGEVEWTREAAEFIAKKEYRYLSPVVNYLKANGQVVTLECAGLTNQPMIRGMKPLVNSVGPEGQKGIDMSAVATALGLPADASAEAMATAANALKNERDECKKVRGGGAGGGGSGDASSAPVGGGGLTLPNSARFSPEICKALGVAETADAAAVLTAINSVKSGGESGQVTLLTNKLNETTAALNSLKTQVDDREAHGRLESAINSGRITKAELDDAKTGPFLKNMARDSVAWEQQMRLLPAKAPANGTLVNSAGATGTFAGGDTGGTDRASIINSAKREWDGEKSLQATTTRAALASLALRDKGLDPKLSDEEKKLVA